MLEAMEYLSSLPKEQIRSLGLILGLSHRTVQNTYQGSSQSSYLQDVLRAWLCRKDGVHQKGLPSWRSLAGALKHEELKHFGIAAKIQADRHF